MLPAIQLDQVTRRFDTVTAVDHLTIDVPTGSIYGFLGPNGAGKTTAVNLMLGLLRPDEGSLRVLGLDVVEDGDEVRARVGALLDEPGLYLRMSAYENLDLYGRIWRLPDRGERIEAALRHIDLWERREDLAGTWSRGMQQRLALARARLHEPEVLFLDEPTAGLDVVAAHAVRQELASLASTGITVFLTTHNMAEAEQLCDRVAVIQNGTLLAEGPPSALRPGAGHEVVVQGRHLDSAYAAIRPRPEVLDGGVEDGTLRLRLDTPDPSAVITALVMAGAAIQSVETGAHLEETFLELMGEPA